MKRLFLFSALILAFFMAGQASEFTLRKAVADFVKSKDIKVSKSLTKGFDPATGANGQRAWTLIKYELEGQSKALRPLVKKMIEAYETDLSKTPSANLFNAYLLHDGSLDADISIRYSDRIDPIDIDNYDNLLLLSGLENEGLNTIIVAQWEDIADDPKASCEVVIYIIERDPYFVSVSEAADPDYYEALRRLSFYASKYDQLSIFESGNAIIEAVSMVVDDIIRNGNEAVKDMAKPIIDRMIAAPFAMATPSEIIKERKKNRQKLIGLLRNLSGVQAVVSDTQENFIIEGTIDPELWDIGYKIRMSSGGINVNPGVVDVIKADGKTFHYDKELPEICVGRLTAMMKDGTDCSADIQFLFVPGEKAIVNVHNGYFSLGGSTFYQDYRYGSKYQLKGYPEQQLDFARQNISRPGVICALFANDIVTDPEIRRQIFDMLPEEIKSGKYGTFLRKYI